MKSKYIAKNDTNTLLVRCECGSHFMEIYLFDVAWNNKTEYWAGIYWWSTCKSKNCDVTFESYREWKDFVDAITDYKNIGIVKIPSVISTKKGLIPDGYIEVSYDRAWGYLDFVRYNKRGKRLWDLTLHDVDTISSLVDGLKELDDEYRKLLHFPTSYELYIQELETKCKQNIEDLHNSVEYKQATLEEKDNLDFDITTSNELWIDEQLKLYTGNRIKQEQE